MEMIKELCLLWHEFSCRRKMNRVFLRKNDPFGYQDSPYEHSRFDAMQSLIKDRHYANALEIGCAEGAFTKKLAGLCKNIAAVDISKVAVERAKKNIHSGSNIAFIEADIRRWKPAPDLYDLIIAGDTLYYLDKSMVKNQFEDIFPMMKSWLKPAGRILLAHGFAGDDQQSGRKSYRIRFENLGMKLICERIIAHDSKPNVKCLISLLEKT